MKTGAALGLTHQIRGTDRIAVCGAITSLITHERALPPCRWCAIAVTGRPYSHMPAKDSYKFTGSTLTRSQKFVTGKRKMSGKPPESLTSEQISAVKRCIATAREYGFTEIAEKLSPLLPTELL